MFHRAAQGKVSFKTQSCIRESYALRTLIKTEGKILKEELAVFTRNLLRKSYHPSLLEAFTSGRLIPLDKNPGIRPIGVGEVLRRIVGKRLAVS